MSERKLSVWILGDQLLANHPALQQAVAETGVANIRVVLVESAARLRKMPYQRKKLVLLLSAMRHYAYELEGKGFVTEIVREPDFLSGLRQHVAAWQLDELLTMAAADENGRSFQNTLSLKLGIPVTILPNTQFLIGQYNPYPNVEPDRKVVMEYFYREMRRHFDVLMNGRLPVAEAWNFDKENRKPLPKKINLPPLPTFEPDEITKQVMAEVANIEGAIGQVDGFNLAVTREHAEAAFADFLAHRLPLFGPYEDAMTQRHATLFHSVLSPYLNIGLLEPMLLIRAVEAAYAQGDVPINSAEGFVRQILGWREFMYWQYLRFGSSLLEENDWAAKRPLPEFFWSGDTDMNCLQHVIHRAVNSGYIHHIERLMVLCNFAVLARLAPAEVNNWFLAAFVDAYEWVMLPNVLGMGLNADGGRIATKPYIASAYYINKMSDYCADCRFKPKQRHGEDACPFNFLYWHFLITHEDKLRANPRLGRNVLGLRHLDEAERTAVTEQAKVFLKDL